MKRHLHEDMALKSDLIKFHLLDRHNNKIIDEEKVIRFLEQLSLGDLCSESEYLGNCLIKTKTYKIINPFSFKHLFIKIQNDKERLELLETIVDEIKIEIASLIIIELDKNNFAELDHSLREEFFNTYINEVKILILKELLEEVDKNNDFDIHAREERINIAYDALNAFIKLDGWKYIESIYSG